MKRLLGRRGWLAGGVSLLAVAGGVVTASAQDAGDAPLLEEIIVTGTHLRGTEPIASTVQTISAADLMESGRATVGDLMRNMPVNFSGSVASGDNTSGGQDFASFGGNLSGGQGINLRGLGALSTLVLVNGRRVAASGQFGDFVDISNIPAIAIDRMEILPDGASAVYGSDAVGGVVNIMLAKPKDEQVSTLRIAPTTQGGGLETQLGHRFGATWDTGGVVVGYEYYHRDRVKASQRDIFNGGDLSESGGVNWPYYTAHAGTAANIFSGTPVGSGRVIYSVPGGAGTGLTASSLIPVTNGVGNTYDPWTEVDILPEMERHSLYVGFEQEIGDRIDLYGDARYTRRRGNYNNGYAVLYNTLPSTNPYYITGLGSGANAFGVVLDDKVLERDVSVDSYGGQLGARVDLFGDWQLDATASFSVEDQGRRSDQLRDSNVFDKVLAANGGTASAPSSTTCALMGVNSSNISSIASPTAAQRFCAALNYTPFNPYSTDPVSDQVLSQIIGYEKLSYLSWLGQGSLKLDGTLFELPGGPVKVAVGTDVRREHIEGDLEFNYRSINTVAVPYGATERDVLALFGEAAVPLVGRDNQLPLVKQLELSAAVRYEDYSGQGGDQDSIDPKFGLTYKPFDALKLKASWGTSFHAPPMRYTYTGAQPVPGGNAAFVLPASYTAPCSTDMVRLNGVIGTPGSASGNCSFNLMVIAGGSSGELKPESAETWSAGLDFESEALPGFRAGLNYFNLKIDDRIVRLDSGSLPTILAEYFATGSSPYASNINLNPSEAEAAALFSDARFIGQFGPPTAPVVTASSLAAIVDATQLNLASLKMNGLDFNLSYEFDTDNAGSFALFGSGTVIFNYKIKSSPGKAYEDRLDQYGDPSNPVSFRSKQGVSWSKGPLNITTTVNYTGDYECTSGCYVTDTSTGLPVIANYPIKVDDWATVDLHASYDLSGLGDFGNDSTIALSVVNLFDKDPPFIDGGALTADVSAMVPNPYDPANGTVIGRTIALTFTKRW